MTEYWEDAANKVVDSIFDFIDSCGNEHIIETIGYTPALHIEEYEFSSSGESGVLKSLIDFYLEICANSDREPHQLKATYECIFYIASLQAVKIFQEKSESEDYGSIRSVNLDREFIANTVIKKQHDYGPNNISKFGTYGLIVRLHDKIARLENLLSSTRKGTNLVQDETIFDTLTDIVGYCTVGLLWVNDKFLLPMRMDQK